jgi:putative inorganic carbon (hco3(-)) transporter
MHFGLEPYIPYVEYLCFFTFCLLTVFWRPIVGIFLLVPMIPLQTIRYRINDFPLGASLLGITLLAIVLGLIRRGQPVLPKSPWTNLLCIYIFFTFVSLCLGSANLGHALPIPSAERLGQWKDYILMPLLLLLTAAATPTRRQMKLMVLLMCLAIFAVDHSFWNAISNRDFSTFSNDLRDAGTMGDAGSNGLAAFGAQATTFLLALAVFEKRIWLRLAYLGLAVFSTICVMYSFSRGGYLALLVGGLFLGLVRQRTLLILLLAFFWAGTSLLPGAVQQRVLMTYDPQEHSLDHSTDTRFALWEDAVTVFESYPVMGSGFYTYAYMHRIGEYRDTHNFFLKVLLETGVAGFLLFLWLLAKTFGTGYRLFRHAKDPFLASLGLSLAAWVVCSVVANCFGDRWTFLQVNGYMWVLAGLVSQAWVLQESDVPAVAGQAAVTDDSGNPLEAAATQA